MLRGFYTAAAGMISQQRRQEMLSNNLANSQTPGYKTDQSSLRAFPEMLMHRIGNTDSPVPMKKSTVIGGLNTGVYMQETLPNFTQGDLTETGNKTDAALIAGNLPVNEDGSQAAIFFTVSAGDELRYTRNGNFALDANGRLTTNEGFLLIGTDGEPIELNSNNFTIDENGIVTENGSVAGRLNIALSRNPNELVKEGNGLFRNDGQPLENVLEAGDASFTVKQGFLERSNVDLQQTMTDMMTAYRAFEANQKVLQAYDRSMDKAANEVGRLT